jgi:hypothetical protein
MIEFAFVVFRLDVINVLLEERNVGSIICFKKSDDDDLIIWGVAKSIEGINCVSILLMELEDITLVGFKIQEGV